MLKIVRCAWENSDVSSSVQDFHRWHFEIVTSAAASIPKEVRAYPQRGSGPVSQAHLERGLRLDLVICIGFGEYCGWTLVKTQENISALFHMHVGLLIYESYAMESQLTGHSSVCPKDCSSNHQGHMKIRVQKVFSFRWVSARKT